MNPRMIAGVLQHLDRICCHPDIDLLKSGFCAFLELKEELPVFLDVRRINEYTDEIIAEELVIAPPHPMDRLSFARDRAEMLPQVRGEHLRSAHPEQAGHH